MRTPDELTFTQRMILTFVIVLVILFAIAAFGYLGGRWDEADAATPDLYQGIPVDEKLLQLDKRALDEAYHGHLIKLFNVWLTDGAREAHRFTTGLKIARTSYLQAAEQIAKREKELEKPK